MIRVCHCQHFDKCLNPCSVHSTELGTRAPKTKSDTGLKKLASGEVNVSVKGNKSEEIEAHDPCGVGV